MNSNWYIIEKNHNGYTVWLIKDLINKDSGGGGCLGIFTSQYKKECIQYCKEHNIFIEN